MREFSFNHDDEAAKATLTKLKFIERMYTRLVQPEID